MKVKFYKVFPKVGTVQSFLWWSPRLEAHVFDLDTCSYVCGLVNYKNHHLFDRFWMRKRICYIGRNDAGEFVLYV